MDNQIYFRLPQQQPRPIRLYLHEWGAQGHVVVESADRKIWFALSAPIGCLADLLEQLALSARAEANRYHSTEGRSAAGLFPGESPGDAERPRHYDNWDWLTPETVIRYFEQSPVLRPIVPDVRALFAEGIPARTDSHAAAATWSPPTQPSQLELDLAACRPNLNKIKANGKINKSEIARSLGIAPGGSSNWPRIQAVAEAIEWEMKEAA